MAEPKVWFKVGDNDEFDPTDQISGLRFMGIDNAGSSPQWTNAYNDQPGLDGSPFAFQTLGKRTLTVKFWLHFTDYQDFVLAKHDVYRLFGHRKAIRIRTDSSPDKVFFAYVTPFDIAPIADGANDANISIPFDVPNGVYYSMHRSDHQDNPRQFGQNLLAGDQPFYEFRTSNFKVYNDSDITVDPYHQRHDLKLIISFGGDKFAIKNTTTNTSMEYKKAIGGSSLIWDGQSLTWYKDGKNDNTNADDGYLTLDPGWNSITIDGANNVDVTFSFPSIYLL